jgi:hypothetical protein
MADAAQADLPLSPARAGAEATLTQGLVQAVAPTFGMAIGS